VYDERLNLLTGSIAKGLHSAEVGGVGLDQVGIELILADELAESVAYGTTAVPVGRLRRQLLRLRRCLALSFGRADLLDLADADAVGLAQSAVDGACFGHAHFCALDKKRDIGRVGISVPNKAGGALGGINCRF
jgi:hypothetical protein